MKTLFALVLALCAVGCDQGSEPAEEPELEANGDTVERACWNIARERDEVRYSDTAHELAAEATETCGPAPAGDVGSTAYYECISEQCNCAGVDPMTGSQVCE